MIETLIIRIKKLINSFVWFLKGLGTKRKWVAVVIGAVIIVGVLFSIFGPQTSSDEKDIKANRTVSIITVGEYSTNLPALSLVGQVKSESEATVTAEAQGVISQVYRSLGDKISAGTIIAELENSSQRASVAQAAATRDASAASLEKVKKGTRDEQLSVLLITRDNAKNSLNTAKLSAENTIRSAYATVDDAVKRNVDQVFSNPNSTQPGFIPQTSNSQFETNAESLRLAVQSIISRQEAMQTKGSIDNLNQELQLVAEELVKVREFISATISALNGAIHTGDITQTQIDAWRLASNAAISSVNASRTSVLSAIDNLSLKESSLAIAEKNLEQGETGGQLEDIQASEASLRQAEASLQVVRVALQKTLLRSPISGTIEWVDLERGQFVSALSPVARVSNIGALEIVAYASERDLKYLEVGSEAFINGENAGVITKVAPSLDPQTKRIEIRIGLKNNFPLTNGQSVEVVVARTGAIETTEIRVPLSSLKVTTDKTYVFSLTDGKIVSHEVIIESILGGDAIVSGINQTLSIIKDARGLQIGQEVTVR